MRQWAWIVVAAALAGCAKEEAAPRTESRPRVRVCALTPGLTFEDAAVVQGSVRTKFTAAVASRLRSHKHPDHLEAQYRS